MIPKTKDYLRIAWMKEQEARYVSMAENYVPEICCVQFGCGKILTREEKLFGNRCIHHQKKPSNVFR